MILWGKHNFKREAANAIKFIIIFIEVIYLCAVWFTSILLYCVVKCIQYSQLLSGCHFNRYKSVRAQFIWMYNDFNYFAYKWRIVLCKFSMIFLKNRIQNSKLSHIKQANYNYSSPYSLHHRTLYSVMIYGAARIYTKHSMIISQGK